MPPSQTVVLAAATEAQAPNRPARPAQPSPGRRPTRPGQKALSPVAEDEADPAGTPALKKSAPNVFRPHPGQPARFASPWCLSHGRRPTPALFLLLLTLLI